MGKVTFEYNENEDSYDLALINKRHTMMRVLYDLADYRRSIYKGDLNRYAIIKDDEVVYKDGQKIKDYDIKDAHTYICDTDIIEKLDDILENVTDLLNM